MTAKRIFPARIGQLVVSVAIILNLSIGNVLADTINIKGDAPETYTVVKGDTLWDISGKYLDKPWLWPELWKGNPQIVNPHLIYPGDVITLFYVDGEPRLGINRAHGTVKLSPKIRATRIDDAIPVIPVEAIQQFLKKSSILDMSAIETGPYVIRGEESRIMASHGDRLYVKGLEAADNKKYQIYNQGDPIKNPATGEILGYEGNYVGDAKLDVIGDPSTLVVTAATREIKVGDHVVARLEDDVLSNIYPKVPDQPVNGQILNVMDGVGIFGRFQTVIVNLGTSDGLDRGHVLSAYTKGETVDNTVTKDDKDDKVTLPDERSGTLMIIQPYDNLSYALAMESRKQMRVLDEVRTPD
jgi:hypothetical protein